MKPDLPMRPAAPPLPSIRWMRMVLLVLAICGCAASPPAIQSPMAAETVPSSQAGPSKSGSQPTVEQRLRAEARKWEGTPHRMGGTQRSGVDCSGFVQRIFNDLFDIKLPRSTAQQIHAGNGVPLHQLLPGDLVFFHPPDKLRHVGIYLGDGEFVHASTSKGVTISRLNSRYWRNAYWTARRVPAVSG